MREDINAVLKDDPAAKSGLQVLLLYSGLHAIWAYRLAHKLHDRGWIFLARFISQLARFFTGVEIHPGARINRRFFIDHGSGIIIGETAEIGNDCLLYQGVTLGGTGNQTGKRHPTLGDRVVVGSGAKILGNIRIGNDVRVGANSVVLTPVPPFSTVVGIPGRVVRRKASDMNNVLSHQNLPDPMMEAVRDLEKRLERLELRGAKPKSHAPKKTKS